MLAGQVYRKEFPLVIIMSETAGSQIICKLQRLTKQQYPSKKNHLLKAHVDIILNWITDTMIK